MPTSKNGPFWTWLSRLADMLQVFGAALIAISTSAWLFIRSAPPPVIILAGIGIFSIVLLLLIRFVSVRTVMEPLATQRPSLIEPPIGSRVSQELVEPPRVA